MQKNLYKINVCKLLNGYDFSLVVHEYTNNKQGPTLGISATIHGDEDLPIEILRQLSLELKNMDFKGNILMLPVANPLALSTFTRVNLIDNSNLNNIFPGTKGWNVGSKEGTISEKIARLIIREYISKIDYSLDLHSGGAVPTVEYSLMYPNCEELAKMLGQKYLKMGHLFPGSMQYYLKENGIPAALGEYGGGGQNNEYYINQGVTGIKNVMKYLKMIDGKPELPNKQYCVKELVTINAKHGGIFIPKIPKNSMHKIFNKEDMLGIIYSPYDFEENEKFYGPFDKNLIILNRNQLCRAEAGELMYMIANMDTVELL